MASPELPVDVLRDLEREFGKLTETEMSIAEFVFERGFDAGREDAADSLGDYDMRNYG